MPKIFTDLSKGGLAGEKKAMSLLATTVLAWIGEVACGWSLIALRIVVCACFSFSGFCVLRNTLYWKKQVIWAAQLTGKRIMAFFTLVLYVLDLH